MYILCFMFLTAQLLIFENGPSLFLFHLLQSVFILYPNFGLPISECLVGVKVGKIVTDLYRKESDRNQYLVKCTNNSPISLTMRIVRICSEPEAREGRFVELKQL
jgi:hypothetical protein